MQITYLFLNTFKMYVLKLKKNICQISENIPRQGGSFQANGRKVTNRENHENILSFSTCS